MKVVVLYRPNSEHARVVEEFVRDFEHRYAGKIELMNIDTREGAATATLYDIVQYPAVLALQNDGQLLKYWEGGMMPLMNEVSYYAGNMIEAH
jgi:thioredoxin-like negative regulator of GroEL